ncbi:MAG: hypothetical protein QM772_13740 [Ottowia sp.]
MRQAGSFMGLATNVDYATEVTRQPLARCKCAQSCSGLLPQDQK